MKRPRVLFVCIGNACRSQMAEGFLRAYAQDSVEVASAGLMPLSSVPLPTRSVMLEKNIPIDRQFPKGVEMFSRQQFDVIVNMSGSELPGQIMGPVEDWSIADPYGRSEGAFRQVRDQIETKVMQLLLRLRKQGGEAPPPRVKFRGL